MKYRNKVCKWKNMNIEYSRDSKENLIRIKKLIKTLKDNSEIYTIIDDNLIKK